jgi:L-ascorbate metabolism protein UlaG (beta-lactamase superfamily)
MQTITIKDGNLFEIAAVHLGNALQWINIARANNLIDPMLSGQTQLTIPPPASAFLDGIGPQ